MHGRNKNYIGMFIFCSTKKSISNKKNNKKKKKKEMTVFYNPWFEPHGIYEQIKASIGLNEKSGEIKFIPNKKSTHSLRLRVKKYLKTNVNSIIDNNHNMSTKGTNFIKHLFFVFCLIEFLFFCFLFFFGCVFCLN